MINDAQVGDRPAVTDDGPRVGDNPHPGMAPVEAPGEESEHWKEEGWGIEQEQAPEPVAEDPYEAEGRGAAESGDDRSSNPYDGRTSQGKAWYRGFDAAVADE